MEVEVSRCCKLQNAEPCCSSGGKEALETFGLFTSGVQINRLIKKKPIKLIYFECNLNANML